MRNYKEFLLLLILLPSQKKKKKRLPLSRFFMINLLTEFLSVN
ncbi:hypothetical protein KF282_0823 [Lactococcus lactis subsp. lactis]|uniref:Uncharacterized protein n=1 Tax=Lactococcus lactis subsp. lactis TaxID=1360 RepID=A0A0V8CZX3_LACLL|nr:hypothetical protein KF282_0823 [Lactococcus lactis subsp. lactis]